MIEINNLTTNPVDEDFLKKVVQIVLKGEGKNQDKVSLLLVGPGRMRKLNKKYFEKNRVTDVLVFPRSKVRLEKFKIGELEKIEGLGQIVICLREVKKNVRRFGFTFEKELAKILIRGIFHLLGYGQKKDEDEVKKMKEKEEDYLIKVFS